MQLGSSLRRRREGAKKSPKTGTNGSSREGLSAGLRRARNAVLVAGLSFAFGWLVATRFVFPAAAPPGDLVAIPDVYLQPVESAAADLREAGLVLGWVDAFRHPSVDSGRVVGQDPLAGQLARPGDSIVVSVSLGPELQSVPDVGSLRVDRARTLLEAAGFVVLLDSLESPEPRGRVIDQVPAPGTEAAVPVEVRLRISLGPPAVIVPDLVGLREEQARDSVEARGLVVSRVDETFRFGADQGVVVTQEPPAGSEVEAGTAVRFTVGRRRRVVRRNKAPLQP